MQNTLLKQLTALNNSSQQYMWNTRWMAWPVMTVVVRGMEGQKNVGHWGMIYRGGETWMAIKMEGSIENGEI